MRCAAPIILLMCVHLSVADDATKSKTDQQIDAKLNAAEKLLNEVGILNDRVVRHLDAQRRALKTFRLSDSEIESLRVLSKGQFAKARQRFENAIGADARQFNRFYAGIACFDLGEYAKAKAHFKLAQKDKTCQPAATLMTLTSARCEVQPPKDDNAVISLFTEAIGELEAATAEAEPKAWSGLDLILSLAATPVIVKARDVMKNAYTTRLRERLALKTNDASVESLLLLEIHDDKFTVEQFEKLHQKYPDDNRLHILSLIRRKLGNWYSWDPDEWAETHRDIKKAYRLDQNNAALALAMIEPIHHKADGVDLTFSEEYPPLSKDELKHIDAIIAAKRFDTLGSPLAHQRLLYRFGELGGFANSEIRSQTALAWVVNNVWIRLSTTVADLMRKGHTIEAVELLKKLRVIALRMEHWSIGDMQTMMSMSARSLFEDQFLTSMQPIIHRNDIIASLASMERNGLRESIYGETALASGGVRCIPSHRLTQIGVHIASDHTRSSGLLAAAYQTVLDKNGQTLAVKHRDSVKSWYEFSERKKADVLMIARPMATLARMKDTKAMPLLLKMSSDDDRIVAEFAKYILKRIQE